jgi:hypothetical protein
MICNECGETLEGTPYGCHHHNLVDIEDYGAGRAIVSCEDCPYWYEVREEA